MYLKKKQLQSRHKNIKLFVEKNMTNLTAIFVHGNGGLNTFFPQLLKIPKVQKNLMCIFLHIISPFAFSNIDVSH